MGEKRRYAIAFVESQLDKGDFSAVVEILSMISGSRAFNQSKPYDGLPDVIFLIEQVIIWFSCAERSGAWTYFESLRADRGKEVLVALKQFGPSGFAAQFQYGLDQWHYESAADQLDAWCDDHDAEATAWAIQKLREHRDDVLLLCA